MIFKLIQLIYACKLQIAVSQNDFRDIFEKTMHDRGPKLCSYVPLISSNNLIALILAIFGKFLPIKNGKKQFQKFLRFSC